MEWLYCLLFACDAGVPVEKPAPPDLVIVRLDDWHDEASNMGGMHYTFSSGTTRYHGGAHGFRGIAHVLPLPIEGDGEQLRGAYYVAKLGPVTNDAWSDNRTFTADVVQFSRPMTEADAKAALANHTAELDYDFAEPRARHPQQLFWDTHDRPVTEYVAVKLELERDECTNLGGKHFWFGGGGAHFHGGGHGYWTFNDKLAVGRYYVAEVRRMTDPRAGDRNLCLDYTPAVAGEVLSVMPAADEADAKAKVDAIPKAGFRPSVQLQ
ncbi:MAG: hypothetical protein QM831_14080 [Kofleriaceae bacterium]